MIRFTHENMATAFQITAIVFIFTYSASPEQNKMKPGAIKITPVKELYKAEKPVTPQTKIISHSVSLSKNTVGNHNFSWKASGAKAMIVTGTAPVTIKRADAAAVNSFPNFTETVFR